MGNERYCCREVKEKTKNFHRRYDLSKKSGYVSGGSINALLGSYDTFEMADDYRVCSWMEGKVRSHSLGKRRPKSITTGNYNSPRTSKLLNPDPVCMSSLKQISFVYGNTHLYTVVDSSVRDGHKHKFTSDVLEKYGMYTLPYKLISPQTSVP